MKRGNKMANKQRIKVTDMKYKDFKKLLREYGVVEIRRIDGSHVKFGNGESSVTVAGCTGGGGTVNFPIVQKILKHYSII